MSSTHLDIWVGADLTETWLALNEEDEVHDLTGAVLAGKMRSTVRSDTVVATLTCTVADAENGLLTVSLTDTETAELRPHSGVWDLFMTQAGVVTPVITDGTYTIRERASR